MKYCTKCGKQIADDSFFCSRCGVATSIKNCPGCGNIIGLEDMLCKYCGKYQSDSVTAKTAKDVCEAQPQYQFPQSQTPQSPYPSAAFEPMPYKAAPYQQLPYPPVMYAPIPPQRKGLFKKGILPLFIWSLILVVLINPVGTTLSAVSTFYLLSANADAEDTETSIRKKKSLILNIAASAIDFLTFIVLFIMAITIK